MQVTNANFEAVAAEVARFIRTCTFYAVDQEMTGISAPDVGPDACLDALAAAYPAKRTAAERYNAFQIGICTFHESKCESSGKVSYVARPFNFWLRNRTSAPSDDVRLNLSAVDFLLNNSMDFQRWLQEGLPYANDARLDHERAYHLLGRPSAEQLTDVDREWVDAAFAAVIAAFDKAEAEAAAKAAAAAVNAAEAATPAATDATAANGSPHIYEIGALALSGVLNKLDACNVTVWSIGQRADEVSNDSRCGILMYACSRIFYSNTILTVQVTMEHVVNKSAGFLKASLSLELEELRKLKKDSDLTPLVDRIRQQETNILERKILRYGVLSLLPGVHYDILIIDCLTNLPY